MNRSNAADRVEGVGRGRGGTWSALSTRADRWLARFRWKVRASETPVAAASRHPAAGPTADLVAANAQAGASWAASVAGLVTLARTRDDKELLRGLRWMRTALEHWLAASDQVTGDQLRAYLDEIVVELVRAFRALVELGVARQDVELLVLLGNLQRTWMRWAESSEAGALEAARSNG